MPEVACRPASTEEILKKHVLELRPSRKRRRQLLAEDDEDEEDHLPFEDDGNEARGLKSRTDGTAPYLEVGVDEPSGGAQSGMAANPGLMHDESSPMEDIFGGNDDVADEQEDYVPTPAEEAIPQPPGLEHLPSDVNPSGSLSGQQQPEIEESPVVSHPDNRSDLNGIRWSTRNRSYGSDSASTKRGGTNGSGAPRNHCCIEKKC